MHAKFDNAFLKLVINFKTLLAVNSMQENKLFLSLSLTRPFNCFDISSNFLFTKILRSTPLQKGKQIL